MAETRSIYQKINEVRKALLRNAIKADTKAFNYTYIDLPQIEPAITEECVKVGLLTMVSFTADMGSMTVYDTDTDTSIVVEVPVNSSMVHIMDKNPIQNVGGMMTYIRRYLYMNVFAISEHDEVEEKGSRIQAEETGRAIGEKAARAQAERAEQEKISEEMADRVMMLDYLRAIDPQAVEKMLAYRKVQSVDELPTAYISKVYQAKQEVKK